MFEWGQVDRATLDATLSFLGLGMGTVLGVRVGTRGLLIPYSVVQGHCDGQWLRGHYEPSIIPNIVCLCFQMAGDRESGVRTPFVSCRVRGGGRM